MRKLILSFVALLVVSWANSLSAAGPQQLANTIAPYLDDGALVVAHVDLDGIDAAATLKQIAEIVNLPTEERAAMRAAEVDGRLATLKNAGGHDIYAVFSLANIPQNGPYLIVPVPQGGDARAVAAIMFGGSPNAPTSRVEADRTGYKGLRQFEICKPLGDAVFCGRQSALERLKLSARKPRPELTHAFAAVAGTTAQVLVLPSDDSRRVLREMLPQLPAEFGGGSAAGFAEGFRWAAAGIVTPPKLAARIVIQAKDADSANALHTFIISACRTLAAVPEVQKQVPMFEGLVDLFTPQINGAKLTVELTAENQGVQKLMGLVTPPVEQAREGARRSQCKNNLKHLGIAMHNFHDAYGSFPPSASYDTDGKKLLSWRVYVLPFLDQNKLYRQFHLDEPWDSEHNRQLIAQMPRVFACPSAKLSRTGLTTYLAPTGEKTVFSGRAGVPLKGITDGTSNTIMIVDAHADQAVVWTRPDDLAIDVNDPLQGLVGNHPVGFHCALCDGSVRTFSKDIAAKTLSLLFMRNDGQVPEL